MLLAIDFDEDFIDVESVAIASVLSLQSAGINGTEFDAPQANCFAANCDASLSENVFNIQMTQIEAIIEPDGIRNDIWRESVVFVSIHTR